METSPYSSAVNYWIMHSQYFFLTNIYLNFKFVPNPVSPSFFFSLVSTEMRTGISVLCLLVINLLRIFHLNRKKSFIHRTFYVSWDQFSICNGARKIFILPKIFKWWLDISLTSCRSLSHCWVSEYSAKLHNFLVYFEIVNDYLSTTCHSRSSS